MQETHLLRHSFPPSASPSSNSNNSLTDNYVWLNTVGYESFIGFNLTRRIAPMASVLIDTADILVTRFLHMTDDERGRRFGFPSIALFFAAFGFGYKENSKIITSLLIAGGAINVGSLLVAPAIGLLHY